MGPLVPEIITDELNLLVALLVGIAFGFILEQAGFSSSRKLTGLFYGTDFTVLRVFFTAGITAMTGVLLLGNLGLLDLGVIYVNPTFVTSALVGGAIMGVGFVVGGYCPGTSFCGAAVGRIDGLIFVVGGLAGAWAFGEAFPVLEGFYGAQSMGDLTLPAAMGVSPGVVIVGFTLVAITAFIATGAIERRVNPASPVASFPRALHAAGALALVIAAVLVGRLGTVEARVQARAVDPEYRKAHPVTLVTPDEVAFRLLDGDPRLQLIDVRTAAAFSAFSLPRAVNIPTASLFGQTWRDRLSIDRDLKVLFADDEQAAADAAAVAELLGYRNVAVLAGGLRRFRGEYLQGDPAARASLEEDTRQFRLAAAPRIARLVQERGASRPVERKPKKVAGGCGV